MKISINSTFSYIKFNLNYGSALQCYALQRYLKSRGHSPEHLRDYRANPIYILKRLKNIKYVGSFFKKAAALIRLQGFIRRNMNFSQEAYISDRGLKKRCPKVDCHIVGSDQIWHNANNFRYLTYAPDSSLKLSYAASFGRADISDEMKKTITPWLKRFDGISVREKSGVKLVESMTNGKAIHVLDPTLLLDWESYPYKKEACVPETKYGYCYFLNLKDTEGVAFSQIKEIVSEKGMELYLTAPLNYPLFLKEKVLFPSVEEWLGLYKAAECIFTNTYHGMLFCIIFRKQFVVFIQNREYEAENERFYSLLDMLGLRDRIAMEKSADEIRKIMQQPIDYDEVYRIIKDMRKKTDAFFEEYGL